MSALAPPGNPMPPMTYSAIPNTLDRRVHAVWDWMIRAAFVDAGRVRLRAVCAAEARPDNQLTTHSLVCDACRAALPEHAIPRPTPGNPMLAELARVHAEMTP